MKELPPDYTASFPRRECSCPFFITNYWIQVTGITVGATGVSDYKSKIQQEQEREQSIMFL
jgi:hypothetical protein